MLKQLVLNTFILFGFLLFFSCSEPFDIDTNDSVPVIVVYGYFTDELTHHSIKISTSSPYFDSQPNRGIPNANVYIISSEDEVIRFVESDTIQGLYQTKDEVAGVPNLTYTLNVEVDFDNDGIKEIYKAISRMQPPIEIDSITIRNFKMMGENRYAMYMYAQDPPDEDYYLCRYKINTAFVLDSLGQYSLMNDKRFNGQYIDGMLVQMFADAESENDREQISLSLGDTVELIFGRIEKGYHDFIAQCQDEKNGESPFFGSPASNIVSNISNGGKGYFACYSRSIAKTIVKSEKQ
jgi:hypothetical protein